MSTMQASGQPSLRYIELDFREVTRRKIEIIAQRTELWSLLDPLQPLVDYEEGSIVSSSYSLVPCDLRDAAQLDAALLRARLDARAPTLVLAECVLVYLPPEAGRRIVSRLGEALGDAAFVVYEQIKPYDAFGRQMMLNLESRGCPLVGIHATSDLEAQQRRFTDNGWQSAWARDMDSVYEASIRPEERRRIEKLEIFDELEEWHLIQGHYCLAVGINNRSGLFDGFKLPTYAQSHIQQRPPFMPSGD